MFLPRTILEKKLLEMLSEDLGLGDITTASVIPSKVMVEAEIVSKDRGIVAGIEEVGILLESLGVKAEPLVTDGEKIRSKQVLMEISGDARTILSAERTALNVLSRMSGIATATRDVVEKVRSSGAKAKVACTRKTAPGLIYFDKKAVLTGGGGTHRLHLDDMILIKDNHIAVAGGVEKAVRRARERTSFAKKIEVEVTKIEDVLAVAGAGADIIMLDNFAPSQIERAVVLLRKKNLYGKVLLEASGGITSENVVKFASAGVDIVSSGWITHSAKALNISLEISKVKV